jgi:hypothetical protein
MYFGTGAAVAAALIARAATARETRLKANWSASCVDCPSGEAAA